MQLDGLLDRHKHLSDAALVDAVAEIVGEPRASVVTGQESFVLHAPLELLARAALLPLVAPEGREGARRKLVDLAEQYSTAGPAIAQPEPVEFPTLEVAGGALRRAIDEGDAHAADVVAAWLGSAARPDQLIGLLGSAFLPSLDAAGHANIYLAMLARYQPRGLPGLMLRHPIAALARGSGRRIELPDIVGGGRADAIAAALGEVKPVGELTSSFIAPLVEHAAAVGTFTALAPGGRFVAPDDTPWELLRFAAQAMLHGPAERAPYGWSHALTLAQAPLLMTIHGAPIGAASYVAAAYLAAHWNGHGAGGLAADAAWPSASPSPSELATAASNHHDAHLVKYTLACLDAAACDPAAAHLYRAAARYLIDWWRAREASPG